MPTKISPDKPLMIESDPLNKRAEPMTIAVVGPIEENSAQGSSVKL
ncbi:hypothetical protein N7326_03195 [Corynebacterium sp. ES2794-CONJ1]|nr:MULTISPECIES: hypothetical protein [unclassified Corynebacterium]MCS4489583.1 hypothetical protein [Corynebacterium sp. ES2775-CONJ]MCS4491406.1 hypothetical protein [Corynebacterium sp. ES2715-CONJ3]MCS4531493.1 hypothetical protein [Corynebacterium sp. ES2730-CONJ]MCU9518881.1 hypothetical protein [Corynebacterium sp. ES2794-CONJ1]